MKSEMDLVSVYIPTKNRPLLLERAIQSVLDQTYKKIEIIVVDDNSSEGIPRKIIELLDRAYKYKIIRLNKDSGAPYARNVAIENATGKFITGLDDDDYFLPNRISYFLSHWDDQYSFLSARSVENTKTLLNNITDILIPEKRIFDHHLFFDENVVGNQVFTLRSRMVCEKFDTDLPALQDFELWFRLSKRYGRFLALKGRTQVIDTSHQHQRITNYERRNNALNFIVKKYNFLESDFRCQKCFWFVEFNKKIPSSDLVFLFKKFRFKLLIRYALKSVNTF